MAAGLINHFHFYSSSSSVKWFSASLASSFKVLIAARRPLCFNSALTVCHESRLPLRPDAPSLGHAPPGAKETFIHIFGCLRSEIALLNVNNLLGGEGGKFENDDMILS